jgi:murein DD-endopeptidase MepM/ murein hydrolase activator NlpD
MSRWWVLASAGGMIARSERNVVAIDLDGDGHEQTGWVIIYMHVADKDRIAAGVSVKTDDPLGHASCEGGTSTGTHVHIARKYNGEWIAADGPLPFVLSGWQAFAGQKVYIGGMTKGSQQVVASPVGPRTSILIR